MFERLSLNVNHIIRKTLKISGLLFSIIAILLSFISWTDIGVVNMCYRIGILIAIILVSLIISIVYIIYIKNSRVVWEHGSGKIIVRYSDIINQGFKKKIKGEQIIVIPVNTCFDTIVDSDITGSHKPMVSPNTIHGQWIKSMGNIDISSDELNKRIQNYIKEKNIKPVKELSREVKKQGNLLSYGLGTVIPIKGKDKSTFYLLALSEFDENNNAQSSVDNFIECVKKVIQFYDKNGQGFDLYIPLMGTNLSRGGIFHLESFQKTKSKLEVYSIQKLGQQ